MMLVLLRLLRGFGRLKFRGGVVVYGVWDGVLMSTMRCFLHFIELSVRLISCVL